MPNNQRLPVCIALVLCDQVYPIANSDGFIFVNVFHVLRAPAFPFAYPGMAAYFTTTDGMGEYDVTITIENAQTGREVAKAKGKLDFKQPLGINDTVLMMRNLVFPHPGKYWADLHVAGQLLVQRPFFVDAPRPRKAPPQQQP